MKKFFVFAFFIPMLALSGCGNGGGGSSDMENGGPGSSNTADVSVRLTVESPAETQKNIAVGDNVNSLSYWYTAVPQWTGSGTIKGTVSTPAEFTNGGTIGPFQPGNWLFYVEIRNTVQEVSTTIYSGSAEAYISSGSSAVTIYVSTAAGEGDVDITLYVPTASQEDGLEINWSGTDEGSGIPAIAEHITEGEKINWTKFTKTITGLPAGGYIFSFDYSDGTTKDSLSGGQTGGGGTAVNISAGATTTITGYMENGTLRTATSTVITPGFNVLTMKKGETPAGVLGNPGTSQAEADADTEFTVICTPKAGTELISYDWYLNSVSQDNDSLSYTLNVPAGTYMLTCIATGTDGVRTYTASVTTRVDVE